MGFQPVLPAQPAYAPGFGLIPTSGFLFGPTVYLQGLHVPPDSPVLPTSLADSGFTAIYQRLVVNPAVERFANGFNYFDLGYAYIQPRIGPQLDGPVTPVTPPTVDKLRLWRLHFYHFLPSQGGRVLLAVDSYLYLFRDKIRIIGRTNTSNNDVVTEVWGGFSSLDATKTIEWRYFGTIKNDREYTLTPKYAGSPPSVYIPSRIISTFQNKVFSIGGMVYSPHGLEDALKLWKMETFDRNTLLYSNALQANVLGGYVSLPSAEIGEDLVSDGRILYVLTNAGVRAYVGDFFNNLESFDVDAPLPQIPTNVAEGRGVAVYVSNNSQVVALSSGKSQIVYDMSFYGGKTGIISDIAAQDGLTISGTIPDEDGQTQMVVYADEHHVEHITIEAPTGSAQAIPPFDPSSISYTITDKNIGFAAEIDATHAGVPLGIMVQTNVVETSSRPYVVCMGNYFGKIGNIFVDNVSGMGSPISLPVSATVYSVNGSPVTSSGVVNCANNGSVSASLTYTTDTSTDLPTTHVTVSSDKLVLLVAAIGQNYRCVSYHYSSESGVAKAFVVAPTGTIISFVTIHMNTDGTQNCQIF